MSKKKFLLNVTFQIEAENEEEALEILSREETLEQIAKALAENRERIEEIHLSADSKLLN